MVSGYSGVEGLLIADTMVFYGTVLKLKCFH